MASGLTTAVRDTGQLVPMAAAGAANTGGRPQMLRADNGYLTEDNLATLRGQGQRGLLGVGREGKPPAVGDGVSALCAAGNREGARGVGFGVRRLQPPTLACRRRRVRVMCTPKYAGSI